MTIYDLILIIKKYIIVFLVCFLLIFAIGGAASFFTFSKDQEKIKLSDEYAKQYDNYYFSDESYIFDYSASLVKPQYALSPDMQEKGYDVNQICDVDLQACSKYPYYFVVDSVELAKDSLLSDDVCAEVMNEVSQEEIQYFDLITQNKIKSTSQGCVAPYALTNSGFLLNVNVKTFNQNLSKKIGNKLNEIISKYHFEGNPNVKLINYSMSSQNTEGSIKTPNYQQMVLLSLIVAFIGSIILTCCYSYVVEKINEKKSRI